IVQQSQSHLRGRRGNARRPAAAIARPADPRRRAARGRLRDLRAELGGVVRRPRAGAARALVARRTRSLAGKRAAGHAALCLSLADLARTRARVALARRRGSRLLRGQGQSASGELEAVEKIAGSAALPKLFTPNFAPRADYELAWQRGVPTTLDALHPLREWPVLFANREIMLRVDLGRGLGHHDKVRTGGAGS